MSSRQLFDSEEARSVMTAYLEKRLAPGVVAR